VDDLLERLSSYLDSPEDRELLLKELRLQALPSGEEQSTTERPRTGKHDPRNALNDLTGSEWVFFLNSVEVTAYPTRGAGAFSHEIRKLHPSPKPPQLMNKIIQFFTRRDEWVLDPFVGVGGTLLGCTLAGRNGLGIDLDNRYLDLYGQVCERESIPQQHSLCGDARDVVSLVRAYPQAPKQFDLILTDPPYGDMMARGQTGENKKRTGAVSATPFTASDCDLGNLPLADFLSELRGIMVSSVSLLKPGGYCVVFCKDLQPTREHHNMLHADVVEELLKIEKLSFKGYKIWYDKTPNLYPFGYPFAFVSNQLHQYILVFRKEKY